MALEEKLKREAPKGADLSKEEEDDADMATAMAGAVMSSEDMVSNLVQQTANAEPVMAVGQFVAEAMLGLKEQADANGMKLADKIWTAKGGVADRLVDQAILNLVAGGGPDLEGQDDAIFQEVVSVIKM